MQKNRQKLTKIAKKLRDLVDFLIDENPAQSKTLQGLSERELIQLESEIGRELFGAVKPGHRREFFNTSPTIWIWHEEWKNQQGKTEQLTTKYEIRQDGIWKVQPGPHYQKIIGQELQNFIIATKLYYERVARQVYGRDPKTGQKLL